MSLRKAFLWSMIVSLAAAALLGIAALVLPRYGPEEEMLISVTLFATFSLIALVTAAVMERGRLVWAMRAGLATAAAALIIWLVMIWFDRALSYSIEENLARLAGSLTIASVLAPQCGLLLLARLDQPGARWLRAGTIAVSMTLAAYCILLIWAIEVIDDVVDDEILARAGGVLGILAACGTVITPILWKIQLTRHGSAGLSADEIRVFCPMCGRQQVLPTGTTPCGNCGLKITIGFDTPHCVCGYLLHGLTGDRCPECGRPLPRPSP